MRRNNWILNLSTSTMALAVTLFTHAPQSLQADTRAGIRPIHREDEQKWKHIPKAAKNSQGGNVGFSNPLRGRSLPGLRMPKVSMPKLPGFGKQEIIGPKVITKDDNQSYLSRSGPVHLQFNGYQAPEFDRNDIIYVEHEGQFPRPPEPPKQTVQVVAPPPPVAPTPPPPPGVGATSAPITVSTKPGTLKGLLEGANQVPTGSQAASLMFHKKVDGLSPSSQEIYTPFVIPYNVTPPAVSIKGKVNYIRE